MAVVNDYNFFYRITSEIKVFLLKQFKRARPGVKGEAVWSGNQVQILIPICFRFGMG